MSTATTLSVQAGEPYTLHITLTDGKDTWPSLDDCEVRAQIRRYRSATSDLILDLTPFLTATFDGNNITVDLALTGGQTRTLRGGHYDVVISDTGTSDERAIVLVHGTVDVTPIVTSAS